MNLDELITRGAVQPFLRLGRPRPGIPVLMYHSLAAVCPRARRSYFGTVTSPARFARQLQWLVDAGYRTLSMDELVALLARGGPRTGDERCVVITFDDGFRDNFTEAAPLLRQQDYQAVFYLPTACIGEKRRSFAGRDCLTWDEVRQMQCAGFQFGSHTAHHPELVRMDAAQVWRELTESKEALEQNLGCAITAFSYPYAFPEAHPEFVHRLGGQLAEAGYTSCVTTMIGRVQAHGRPFFLRRLPVNERDDRRMFLAKLEGAYDWLAVPQRLFKQIRRLPAGGRA